MSGEDHIAFQRITLNRGFKGRPVAILRSIIADENELDVRMRGAHPPGEFEHIPNPFSRMEVGNLADRNIVRGQPPTPAQFLSRIGAHRRHNDRVINSCRLSSELRGKRPISFLIYGNDSQCAIRSCEF